MTEVTRVDMADLTEIMAAIKEDPKNIDPALIKRWGIQDALYRRETIRFRLNDKLLKIVCSQILYEKYRATCLEDYVCSEKHRGIFNNWILGKTPIPHLILASKESGTGKTTLLKMLANEMDAELWFDNPRNGGIDGIRNGTTQFLDRRSVKRWKFVGLDEADGSSAAASDYMKTFIEKYDKASTPIRFFFTTNNPEKLDNALHSRCTTLELGNDLIDHRKDVTGQMLRFLAGVCKAEKIQIWSDDGTPAPLAIKKQVLRSLIDRVFPDMRRMMNFLDLHRAGFKASDVLNSHNDLEMALARARDGGMTDVMEFTQRNYANWKNIIRMLSHRSSLDRYFEDKKKKAIAISAIAKCDIALSQASDSRIHLNEMFMFFYANGLIRSEFTI